MIQRIIDWYNGYTLQEKLELELLLNVAYIGAIEEVKTLDVSELLYKGCVFDTRTKKKKTKKTKKVSDVEACICGIARVVNVEDMDFGLDRTKAQINLLKLKGSTVRVRLGIDLLNGERYQFCKEYCIEDLQRMKEDEKIKRILNKI